MSSETFKKRQRFYFLFLHNWRHFTRSCKTLLEVYSWSLQFVHYWVVLINQCCCNIFYTQRFQMDYTKNMKNSQHLKEMCRHKGFWSLTFPFPSYSYNKRVVLKKQLLNSKEIYSPEEKNKEVKTDLSEALVRFNIFSFSSLLWVLMLPATSEK